MMVFHRKKEVVLTGFLLFLFLWLMPVPDVMAKTKTYGDFTYDKETVEGKTEINIIDYNGTEENLVIPDKIESLEVCNMPISYKYPDKIKTITVPKTVRILYGVHLSKLKNLEEIRVVPENKYYKSVDGIIYNKKGTEMIFYPRAKKGDKFVMPLQVTETDGNTFLGNRYLKTIIWGDNCKYVEGLSGSNVETVITGKKAEVIVDSAFWGCKNLKRVVLGENISIIEEGAFAKCRSLSRINLPKSLNKIEYLAFWGCKSLGTLKIPKNVYLIEEDAFRGSSAKVKLNDYLVKDGRHYIGKTKVDSGSKTKQMKIKSIRKIRPEKSSVTVKKGKKYKLNVKVYNMWGEKKGILKDRELLSYVSSNPKVVKVTSHGNMTGLKKGKATITIRLNEYSCKVRVKVK